MTFTPLRVFEKDPISEEVVLKNSKVQANFDLIAKETKRLDGAINSTNEKTTTTKERMVRTRFRDAFLFG